MFFDGQVSTEMFVEASALLSVPRRLCTAIWNGGGTLYLRPFDWYRDIIKNQQREHFYGFLRQLKLLRVVWFNQLLIQRRT